MYEKEYLLISVKHLQNNFSHLYIEKNVESYPLTNLAIESFPKATIIWIDHYKDIFNRGGQDFQNQKATMKLILAKKDHLFFTRHQIWFKNLVRLMHTTTHQF
ncbi:hypothetical protein Ct9H90mP29_13010 [bacterium]|nr:MAG: hypothetical protein Ct9H90mP29_13010 [bacterium]